MSSTLARRLVELLLRANINELQIPFLDIDVDVWRIHPSNTVHQSPPRLSAVSALLFTRCDAQGRVGAQARRQGAWPGGLRRIAAHADHIGELESLQQLRSG